MRLNAPAVEADLQRYYQIDLADLFTGRLSWRRLRVLLDGLPSDSLWWTVLRPLAAEQVQRPDSIDEMRWSSVHDLLAHLIDATRDVAWVLRQVNSTKPVSQPKPFPRPGRKKRRRGMSEASRSRINQWLTSSRIRTAGGDGHGD